jgi:hypothetical protein
MVLICFLDSSFRSRKNAFESNPMHRERHGSVALIRNSSEAAALSFKSPSSLSMESPSLHTSPQSFQQPAPNVDQVAPADGNPDQAVPPIGSEQDEGENSNAFAVALDPVTAPAEDSTLFYSGKML